MASYESGLSVQHISWRLTGVIGVHDARIVEDDIDPAACVETLNHLCDIRLFADIACDGRDIALCIGYDRRECLEGGLECRGRDIRHLHVGALLGEENACFKPDATETSSAESSVGEADIPSGAGHYRVFTCETTHSARHFG